MSISSEKLRCSTQCGSGFSRQNPAEIGLSKPAPRQLRRWSSSEKLQCQKYPISGDLPIQALDDSATNRYWRIPTSACKPLSLLGMRSSLANRLRYRRDQRPPKSDVENAVCEFVRAQLTPMIRETYLWDRDFFSAVRVETRRRQSPGDRRRVNAKADGTANFSHIAFCRTLLDDRLFPARPSRVMWMFTAKAGARTFSLRPHRPRC